LEPRCVLTNTRQSELKEKLEDERRAERKTAANRCKVLIISSTSSILQGKRRESNNNSDWGGDWAGELAPVLDALLEAFTHWLCVDCLVNLGKNVINPLVKSLFLDPKRKLALVEGPADREYDQLSVDLVHVVGCLGMKEAEMGSVVLAVGHQIFHNILLHLTENS
jgi:hypothetical protein